MVPARTPAPRISTFCGDSGSTLGGRYSYERIAYCADVFFRMFGSEGFFLVLTSSDEKRLAPLAELLENYGLNRAAQWEARGCKVDEIPELLAAGDWGL